MTKGSNRGRRKKRNRGWFQPGADARRHQLTDEERSKGGKATFQKFMLETPWMLRWLQRRIDAASRKGRTNGTKESKSRNGRAAEGRNGGDDIPF